MAVSPKYKTFVEELFDPAFPVRIRAMFGGAGIYSGDVMFGLIANERVYLKADDLTRADFAAEGSGPFVWVAPDGVEVPFTYYELPDRLYDEPDEIRAWAMKALDVALRTRKKPAKKKPAKSRLTRGAKKAKPRALICRSKPKTKAVSRKLRK